MDLLSDTSVHLISFASRKTIRKWVVEEVRYEFEGDGSYCSHMLGENEYCEYGSPFPAYTHAKQLVKKYRKKWFDAIVVIREVCVE